LKICDLGLGRGGIKDDDDENEKRANSVNENANVDSEQPLTE